MACCFINKRPLVVMGASDELGYLTPWYLSAENMAISNSQRPDDILLNFHPLTKRAVELQTRLEAFKRDFNLFYVRALRTYGKWKTHSDAPAVGSVVFILDKATTKANFLQRFSLGRISKYLSPHTVELDFMRQSDKGGTTQGLIKALRTGQAAKISLKKCVRDLRDLSILVDPKEESAWARGVDVDQIIAERSSNPAPDGPKVENRGLERDWAHEVAKIPFTFTLELPPTRKEGTELEKEGKELTKFHLKEDKIIPTGKEVWAFHRAIAEKIIDS